VKVIAILWLNPEGKLTAEKYDAAEFSFKTDPGWLKIISKTNGVFRILPSEKVQIVEYAEEPAPPRIIKPDGVLQPSTKYQPS
jgi:hypothetical protein